MWSRRGLESIRPPCDARLAVRGTGPGQSRARCRSSGDRARGRVEQPSRKDAELPKSETERDSDRALRSPYTHLSPEPEPCCRGVPSRGGDSRSTAPGPISVKYLAREREARSCALIGPGHRSTTAPRSRLQGSGDAAPTRQSDRFQDVVTRSSCVPTRADALCDLARGFVFRRGSSSSAPSDGVQGLRKCGSRWRNIAFMRSVSVKACR